jgi:hypothetical protein
MDNFSSLVRSAAQAISMGVSKADVVASLVEKGLQGEETFLVYMAACVFAKGVAGGN